MRKNDFMVAPTDQLAETEHLKYTGGYKYQSRNDMVYFTGIYPDNDIVTDLVILRTDGWLWVGRYFAWDGCSGPTWDDSTNMRAGHAHDALYMLMRKGLLDRKWREQADAVLKRLMLDDDGMPVRAAYYEFAVNRFAAGAADPKNAKRVHVAPKTKGDDHGVLQLDR